jgi:hypothetical protein
VKKSRREPSANSGKKFLFGDEIMIMFSLKERVSNFIYLP